MIGTLVAVTGRFPSLITDIACGLGDRCGAVALDPERADFVGFSP
jgi:hypothetical protein